MSKQCMEALARANTVRFAQADLKREIRSGERAASDVLLEHPVAEELRSLPIDKLIFSTHRLRRQVAGDWLAGLGIRENRPLGELTYRQRVRLADSMRHWELDHQSGRRARPRRTGVPGIGRLA